MRVRPASRDSQARLAHRGQRYRGSRTTGDPSAKDMIRRGCSPRAAVSISSWFASGSPRAGCTGVAAAGRVLGDHPHGVGDVRLGQCSDIRAVVAPPAVDVVERGTRTTGVSPSRSAHDGGHCWRDVEAHVLQRPVRPRRRRRRTVVLVRHRGEGVDGEPPRRRGIGEDGSIGHPPWPDAGSSAGRPGVDIAGPGRGTGRSAGQGSGSAVEGDPEHGDAREQQAVCSVLPRRRPAVIDVPDVEREPRTRYIRAG